MKRFYEGPVRSEGQIIIFDSFMFRKNHTEIVGVDYSEFYESKYV